MLLTQLPLKQSAKVEEILATGSQRRRLLDLGLTEGTIVTAKRKSPSGDPKAFLIRGTTIALRKEETDLIRIVTSDK